VSQLKHPSNTAIDYTLKADFNEQKNLLKPIRGLALKETGAG